MKSIVFIFTLTVLIACTGRQQNKHQFKDDKEKSFYTSYQGMDWIRFPLIMPYELKIINGDENWQLSLTKGCSIYLSINNIDKVSVVGDLLLIHSTDVTQRGGDEAKIWFVINPVKRIEECFSDELSFKEYIKQYNVAKIDWMKPQSAYEDFKDTGCLPWIPGCYR